MRTSLKDDPGVDPEKIKHVNIAGNNKRGAACPESDLMTGTSESINRGL